MYVMSSLPPDQQSIAGGIFNTVSKLCNNLGLGIATSVEGAIVDSMTASTPAIRPYLGVYWFSAAAAGLSLFLIPFLTLGTQGDDSSASDQNGDGERDEKMVVESGPVAPTATILEGSAVGVEK